MENHTFAMELDPTVVNAYSSFLNDASTFALLLSYTDDNLRPLSHIPFAGPNSLFQANLNALEVHLDPRIALYIILRCNSSLVAITFVPYLAPESQRRFLLTNRHELVRQLGENRFAQSLICKEIGEVAYARAWEEREEHANNEVTACDTTNEHENNQDTTSGVPDIGYRKSKCRACDRRMKNKISGEAIKALGAVSTPGSLVQLKVEVRTEELVLISIFPDVTPEGVANLLPTSSPSFTFYRHGLSSLLYFIFYSPDSAFVRERMKHTVAIPGLINVHAEDAGVHVDQKIEIHDPSDLVFAETDERVGKFRSMYLRNHYNGTESVYDSLEKDAQFFNRIK